MPLLSWARGAYRKWNTNESVPHDELQRTGTYPLTLVLDVLWGRFTKRRGSNNPDSGMWGDGDFRPQNGGNPLDVLVGAGIAQFYDSSATSDYGTPSVRPIVMPDPVTVTLDAHDATNPRLDRISLKPKWTDGDSGSRRVRPAGPGSQVVQTLNRRTAATYELVVTKGTPSGSPSVPSLPSGSIPIAVVFIPPTSGAVSVVDARLFLRRGHGHENIPDPGVVSGGVYTANYARSIVIEGGTMSVVSNLTIEVATGIADHLGHRCTIPTSVLNLASADPTNPRYDVIYATVFGSNAREGGLYVTHTTGTPAATPQRPAPAVAGSIVLGYVYIAAADTALSSGDLIDARPLRPYKADRQSVVTIDPRVQCAEVNSTTRQLRIDTADADGTLVSTNAVYYEIELFDGSAGALGDINTSTQAHIEITTGTVVQGDDGSGSGKSRLVVQANTSGVVTGNVVLDGSTPFVVAIRVTPVRWFSGIGTTVKLDGLNGDPIRNHRPGSPVWTEVGFS